MDKWWIAYKKTLDSIRRMCIMSHQECIKESGISHMLNERGATVEVLLRILTHSLPENETVKIIDTNDDDQSVIFNWRNNGYVLSSFHTPSHDGNKPHLAVGRICSNRFSDDNSHILLEVLMNQYCTRIHETSQAS